MGKRLAAAGNDPRAPVTGGVISLLLAATLAAGFSAGALAQSGPDLHAYTMARFVPYTNAGSGKAPFTGAPKLSFLVQVPGGGASHPFTMTMDTGSTGVVISAADLPGYSSADDKYPLGWEFLSSSKLLWVGRWIPRELVFLDAAGGELATAKVPVLAVETQYSCPGWSEKRNQPTCANPQETTSMPTGIAYMGVGFGREHDGQPQGTPDKNPFLNLTAIEGRPIQPGIYRPGYIVTPSGVHLGLSQANSHDFSWTRLQGHSLDATGKPSSNDLRDWAQAQMAVSVNGQPAETGPVLIDTGIKQMYLTVSNPSALPTEPVPNPSRAGAEATGLTAGAEVTVSFPDGASPIAQYAFTVGDTGDKAAPSVVLVNRPGTPAFVNTGRHFLRDYDVAFDADGGWFGFRKVVP
ncbi:hypothetical protein GCM10007874_37540 [Labrys miyagiensis]|uniref:Aspartyl protease n=1 Tax=Labrys miyagiensis TaxID=346912 RepID=A0ABQ6CM68_9HYPH|nr:hypothetical protein [Labrys miyagiensis]GLS20737.1 hypothetical protein GCM10007874_37540 [Labrys miyagiensis]